MDKKGKGIRMPEIYPIIFVYSKIRYNADLIKLNKRVEKKLL